MTHRLTSQVSSWQRSSQATRRTCLVVRSDAVSSEIKSFGLDACHSHAGSQLVEAWGFVITELNGVLLTIPKPHRDIRICLQQFAICVSCTGGRLQQAIPQRGLRQQSARMPAAKQALEQQLELSATSWRACELRTCFAQEAPTSCRRRSPLPQATSCKNGSLDFGDFTSACDPWRARC